MTIMHLDLVHMMHECMCPCIQLFCLFAIVCSCPSVRVRVRLCVCLDMSVTFSLRASFSVPLHPSALFLQLPGQLHVYKSAPCLALASAPMIESPGSASFILITQQVQPSMSIYCTRPQRLSADASTVRHKQGTASAKESPKISRMLRSSTTCHPSSLAMGAGFTGAAPFMTHEAPEMDALRFGYPRVVLHCQPPTKRFSTTSKMS